MRYLLPVFFAVVCLSGIAAADDVIRPAAVTDLSLGAGLTTIVVTWTATGDDSLVGTATEYDLRYAVYAINDTNFENASRLSTGSPQSSGQTECYAFGSFSSCTTYYFALKVKDEANNWSALSNTPSIQTDCSGSRFAECP